jgi:hypothetical protein
MKDVEENEIISRLFLLSIRQQSPPKRWCPNTSLHGVTTQETSAVFIMMETRNYL